MRRFKKKVLPAIKLKPATNPYIKKTVTKHINPGTINYSIVKDMDNGQKMVIGIYDSQAKAEKALDEYNKEEEPENKYCDKCNSSLNEEGRAEFACSYGNGNLCPDCGGCICDMSC